MPVNAPLDENVSNELWLHSHHAAQQVRAAERAAAQLDTLIHTACGAGVDVETIADASFVDVGLVRHVALGGTTFDYLTSDDTL
jgi:hypothetical protein